MTEVEFILYITISISIVSTSLSFFLNQKFIVASTAYWVGWLFLTFGADYGVSNNWIGDISQTASSLIMQMHIGAFCGFLMGNILSITRNRGRIQNENFIERVELILRLFYTKILLILFIIGFILFIQRLSSTGFNLSFLTDIRQVYLERNFSFLGWLGTHISMVANVLVILLAVSHANKRMDLKQLSLCILAGAPLGLASGGRIFLLNYFLLYLSSFLLCRSSINKCKTLLSLSEWRVAILFLISLLCVFALMGFYRGGYGEEFDIFYTIFSWPVSTIGALDSWIAAATSSASTNGYYTLGWFAKFFQKIGINDYSNEVRVLIENLNFFELVNDSAGVVPKSILPEIIFDFGVTAVPLVMFFIALVLQLITLNLAIKGVVYHVLASYVLFMSFMTIQTSVITSGLITNVFWAVVISVMIREKKIGPWLIKISEK
ncbi:O-antigen polymerase [Vibrio breoganii]|uniref:O-antigen polymerase n=1 Tax=Vibrio breoganii TaxID=553239 RepID=UPI0010BD7091|nr:O-antigen polymerase [Vibrio breoganii]TKG14654.1 oligosaccharide repeat unit polymerase [Vibrio breoganii]